MLIKEAPESDIKAKAIYLKNNAQQFLHRDLVMERKRDS